jgi:NitT/TauT family transport system substrate-binding protein
LKGGSVKRLMAALGVAALITAGCAGSAQRARGSAETLRLGIFPNLTHAPGYVALGRGIFEEVMPHTDVEITVFNSGTDAGEALLAGSIDATYIGPGPATNLYVESGGKVALVSGAVSGGASLVVRKGVGIDTPQDLAGRKVAVPGIGNTQDIALRTWLEANGMKSQDEGGDVAIVEVDNPELPQLFRAGQLDAAWEPEPYPSLLIEGGLAELFLDEAELWPEGRFVTTHLLVSTIYMEAHPQVVGQLVEANVEAIRFIQENPDEAKATVQAQLIEAGAPSLDQAVVDAAWDKLEFTWDPVASSLEQDAQDAFQLGYLEQAPTDILDIYRLEPLNAVLANQQLEQIEVIA